MNTQSDPRWLRVLRQDLADMTTLDRILACARWSHLITSDVLPTLARTRRRDIANQVIQPGWDEGRLADTLGTRVGTVRDLAARGRRS